MQIPLEALFDRIPDVVFFVKDRHARYTTVNRTLAERCGVNRKEELLGKTVLDVFPAPLGEAYYRQDRQVLDTGTPVRDRLELHLYLRGEPGWCITEKLPIEDEQGGTIVGLVGVSRDLHTPATDESGYRELAASIRYIQSHYGESLKVDDLARMSSLSVYQFERRLKRVFGITAGQFITRTRIDAACRLLRSSDKPIADVAVECGYYDQSAFTRQFRMTTGLTPRRFRDHRD